MAKNINVYSKMIVPLDSSAFSEKIIGKAIDLAINLGLEVILLNVLSPGEQKLIPVRNNYLNNQVARMHEQIEAETKECSPKNKIKGEVITGQPANEILRYIKNNNINLVGMATHGRSGIGSLTMGSVAYKVMMTSKIPVILVRSVDSKPVTHNKSLTRKIMLPLDGSKQGESVLQPVRTLAEQFGIGRSEVILLSVCEPSPVKSGYPRVAISEGEESAGQKAFIHKLTAQHYLDDLGKQIRTSGIKVSTEVLSGDPAEKIIDHACEIKANLIAMATHGRSGISRFAYGSVAEKVIRSTSTPILIVRP